MPVQRTQSGLLAKLGNRLVQAHEKHKNDTTELSNFGDLPAGVEGVARLVECKFTLIAQGKQNAGQYMFYAAGIVVEPEFHEGLKVAGRRTQISEPFFDTPQSMGTRKTFDDHLEHIYTHLRALGLSTADLDPESLEETVAMLKDTAPYFRFRTWKGKKQTSGPYKDQDPKVQHSWMGKCDFTEEVQPGEGVVDDSVASDTEEAYSPPSPANGNGRGTGKARGKAPANAPAASMPPAVAKRANAGPPPADLEFGDIASLIKKAKKGNEEARQELNDMAMSAGATEEEVLEAEDWDAVAALITAGKAIDPPLEEEVDKDEEEGGGTESEESDEEEDEEASAAPEVDQVVLYRPMDKKTGKVAKKPIDCEVVAVDERKQTVTLKSLDDGKTLYKLVAWTSIEPQE